MGALSVSHWLIVFVVILFIFGPKKLGSIGRSLGDGLRGFREGLDDPKPPEQLKAADKDKHGEHRA
jgi:sec-independent protein translocase protein TatA